MKISIVVLLKSLKTHFYFLITILIPFPFTFVNYNRKIKINQLEHLQQKTLP